MKKLLCLLLALIMLLSLAACSETDSYRDDDDDDEEEVHDNRDDDEGEDNFEDEDRDHDDRDESEGRDESHQEETQPEDSSDEDVYFDALAARHSANTPNGYSMWYSSMGLNTTKRFCVNANGRVTFVIDPAEKEITNVYNAAVATKEGDITRLRSAKDGKILFDSQDYDDAHIVIPDHRGGLMFQDGYILVVSKAESYNGVSFALGFLDPNGTWIHDLSTDNPILSYITEEASMEYFEEDLFYFGEGMLAFEGDDDVYRYYNIKSGKIVEIKPGNGLSADDAFEPLECGILFREGCSNPEYISASGNSGYYLFYTDGRVEKMPMEYYDDFKRSEITGDIYYDRQTQTAYFLFAYSTGLYVVDNHGNLIQWHKDVKVADVNGFKADGTAQIILKNSEDTSYYTVIGVDGQFLFEPVKLDSSIDGVFDTDGCDVEPKSHYGTGKFIVIDDSGRILYESDYVNDFAVSNDVVYFKDKDDFYIDISK